MHVQMHAESELRFEYETIVREEWYQVVIIADNRILSVLLVVILCLVYIRLRFPVLFKYVTISDVTISKNPWAIELKMEMML